MSHPFPLLELVPELIIIIAEELNCKDLNSLLQCNRRLSCLLAPLLRKIALAPKDGYGPLGWAVFLNSEPLARLVLESGVDVEDDIHKNTILGGFPLDGTPLCWAAGRGHNKVVELLLEKGANVNVSCPLPRCGPPVIVAIRHGHDKMARILLKHGALLDPVLGLCLAIRSGNDAAMMLCIEQDPGVLRDKAHQYSFLSAAAHYRRVKILELILENGADVTESCAEGYTALHWAVSSCLYGDFYQNHIYRLESIDEGFRDDPAAFKAQQDRGESIIKILLAHGADVSARSHSFLATPLHFAVSSSTAEYSNRLVEVLIDHGADITAVDIFGCTPLDYVGRLYFI